MKKFLCIMTAALLALALFACTDSSNDETTAGSHPLETSGEETTGTDNLSTTETTPALETTESTPAPAEQTSSSADTEATTEPLNPQESPVVRVTNGTESISCYMTEQSPGVKGGFDLIEDFALLPTLSGESFSLVTGEDRDDLYYGTYMLYDSNFESQGTYFFHEQHQIIDTASEPGTYYVRITVTVGDPILSTEVYHAWATLILFE